MVKEKRSFVFLAEGFEEIEAIATIDILKRAEVDVVSVSVGSTLEVTGAHGITVKADALFEEEVFLDAQCLILPGGMPGTTNLEAHRGLNKLLVEQNKKGGLIAAICAAPMILGKNYLLRNHDAICYPGFESHLDSAFISKLSTVKSGNIITAKSAGVVFDFALMIVHALKGDEAVEQLKQTLYFKE